MDKTQFKCADLDFIPFLDAHEIIGHLPVVLYDSHILYSYIMMIHLTRIHHAGVDITIKAVSNKMFVLEKLGAVVKRIRTDCSKCRIILKKTSKLRMVGACKVHLHPTKLSFKNVENISEILKNTSGNMKSFIFVVNISIRYLLFRFYSTEELMIRADKTMRTVRTESSELG